jgi:hypothetical protein
MQRTNINLMFDVRSIHRQFSCPFMVASEVTPPIYVGNINDLHSQSEPRNL